MLAACRMAIRATGDDTGLNGYLALNTEKLRSWSSLLSCGVVFRMIGDHEEIDGVSSG